MEELKKERVNIIYAITSPLGFFALSLLIVEGFLTVVLVFSGLNSDDKFLGMSVGAGLFLLVVSGVWFLVWFKPENLTFGEDGHLKRLEMESWGRSDKQNQVSPEEELSELISPD